VLDKGEPFVTNKVGYVVSRSSDQIVHSDDRMSFSQETITKMRAKKTCATRYQHTHNIYPFGLALNWRDIVA
jgi:hypothetical protein